MSNRLSRGRAQSQLLSVVIPALNSSATISGTLSSIFSNETCGETFEVLLVDNGSCDGTVDRAREFPVKIFHCSRKTDRGREEGPSLSVRVISTQHSMALIEPVSRRAQDRKKPT